MKFYEKIHLLHDDFVIPLKDIKDFAWISRWKPPVYEKMKININGSYELSFTKYCHRKVYGIKILLRSLTFLLVIHPKQKFWPFCMQFM